MDEESYPKKGQCRETYITRGSLWRHYKGKIYEVIGISTHTETRIKEVVYFDDKGELHHRPLKMFLGRKNGVRRFVYQGINNENPLPGGDTTTSFEEAIRSSIIRRDADEGVIPGG